MQNRRTVTGSEPVSLELAKLNLRIPEGACNDDELLMMISAAREYAESYTGMSMACETVNAYPDTLEAVTRLPFAPVSEISAVIVYDTDGEAHTVDDDDYTACAEGVIFKKLPDIKAREAMPYEIVYTTEPDVPFTAVQAILQLTNHFYDNRSAVTEGSAPVTVPYTVERLLKASKRWWY